ncbi:cation efflux family-domain-containing protein [Terfezia claveryi]|nr:cation efflux family-domain-containing protein [Terfezia claveryi]
MNPMRKTPFNFQQSFASKGPVLSTPAQRRGHRYKHSSISLSHSIIQEAPPRAPLSLPASLPLPTFLEGIASITPQQRLRSLWCLTHILIGTSVLWSAAGSLALTALSHIILFDAFSSTVCVAVDVISNFEVWKRSTIRHPFGLERAEVLAGFAMSIFLVFMGLDIISHTAEHLLEGFQSFAEVEGEAGGEPHDHHSHHSRVPPGSIDLSSLLAIISTLTSALVLQNHARIGKAMRIQTPSFIPFVPRNSLLGNNPSHLLTLIFATSLLILPLLNVTYYSYLDRFLALAISCCMILMGTRLIKSLGKSADGGCDG